ncbi:MULTISPECIES: IPT/TIG domain-containing protein [Lysobacter]|uniref:IPT/TIG domain-containing protein n=2 Tax=Lysobacteraceae TaxID=32033 RepID=UPI001F22E836|nr:MULTISPECIES: IPT/TIG domain-containing protein [Lysobacter]UJB18558.1 IPT/TIG domain-containing protein [Lysobacter capsici]UJQ27717.1 IPT/TIG domain-containing protein [Lysobacter gummosus]
MERSASVNPSPVISRTAGHPRKVWRPTWRLPRIAVVAGLLFWACAAAATTYLYDSNGRLTVATNDAGESARYVYDPMGNITRIDRVASSDIAVFAFSPGRGSAGREIRIQGRGFAPSSDANTVTFSGVPASVVSATTTELKAIVPPGATTGLINVAAGGRNASSVQDFVVDENSQAPVVSSITPLAVSPGATITIDGLHLMPIAGQTSLKLNGRPIKPGTLTDLQALAPIPVGASSGRVLVSTPYGAALSSQTVLVLPDAATAANVVDVKDVTIDAPAASFSTAADGKFAAAVFYAASGDYLTAQFSSMVAGSRVRFRLFNVNNEVLTSGTVTAENPSLHMPRINTAGTYMLLMQPEVAPATWSVAIERAKPLTVDGAVLPVDTVVAGQQRRMTFDPGTATNLGLGVADRVPPVTWGAASLYVYRPDGTQVSNQFCDQTKQGCGLNLTGLSGGVHTLVIAPASTGSRLLGLDVILSTDRSVSLTRDVAIQLSLDRRGMNGRLTFNGTAGEMLALQVAGQTTSPANRDVYYRILGPDRTTITSISTASGATLTLILPTTGSYEVLADTENGETLSAQVKLATGASSMQVDGADGVFEASLAGQGIFATFAASTGQNMGIGISDLELNSGLYVNVIAYKPDGRVATSTICYAANAGCDLNLPNSSAGTYGVAIQPRDASQTMRFKASVSSDAVSTLRVGSTATMTIGRRGQNARMAFAGAAGQVVKIDVAAQQTVPADGTAYYRLQKPDGSYISSMGVLAGKSLIAELPIAGDYTLLVDPAFGATASSQVTLSPGVFGAMVLDGETGQYQTTTAGQVVELQINGTAGKSLGLGITDLVTSTGDYVYARWISPSGSEVTSVRCSVGTNCDLDLPITVTGTHRVRVTPEFQGQTFKFKATLSSDLTATLVPDMPRMVAIERAGQNAKLSFNGAVGQVFAVLVSGQTNTPESTEVAYSIKKADGSSGQSRVTRTGTGLFVTVDTPGTYVLSVDPSYASTPTARVTLSSGTAHGLEVNGAGARIESVAPGDWAFISVDATQTGLGLGISDLVSTVANRMNMIVYPWERSESTVVCEVSLKGCDADISKRTGRYGVLLAPTDYDQVLGFTLTLSTDMQGVIRRDEPMEMALTRRGQNAYYSFEAKAGERLGLSVAGQVTQPASRPITYRIVEPNGSFLSIYNQYNSITGTTVSLLFPETGTYKVFVDPDAGEEVRARVELSTGKSPGVSQDGTPTRFETRLPGQGIYLTTSTADSAMKLSLRNLVLSSGSSVVIYAGWPGSNSTSEFKRCYASDGGCDLDLWKSALGPWGIVILPSGDTYLDQAMQFTASLTPIAAKVASADFQNSQCEPDDLAGIPLPSYACSGNTSDVFSAVGRTEVSP